MKVFPYALVGLLLSTTAVAQDPDRVTMKLEDFLKLYEQSRNRPKDPAKPPVDTTLSTVAWTATLQPGPDGEPSTALLTARIRVDRHGEGWTAIPLISQQAALIRATLDGRPAPIALRDGWYQLITSRTGGSDLLLELALPVVSEQGVSSFSLPLAAAGPSTLSLTLPTTDDLDVTIGRARVLSDTKSAARRVIEATFTSLDTLAVRWQRRTTIEAVSQEPRVYATVNTLVSVGDGLLTAQVAVDHAIRFAGVDTFRYALPVDMTVLDVTGPGLRDWSINTQGQLVAVLSYAAEERARIGITLERSIGEGSRSFDTPILTPLGMERTKGFLGVAASGGLEVAPGKVEGATPIDVRTLPADVVAMTRQPLLLAYKYLDTAVKIPLQATQHTAVDVLVTLLDQVEGTTMFTVDGRRLTQVVYHVRNNRRQFLRLQLPKGAELWSAAVAGAAVQPTQGTDGALLMPLVRSADEGGALTSFPVEVVYVETGTPPAPRGAWPFEAELPRADVPATWVGWTVYAPYTSRIPKRSFDGSLRPVAGLSRPPRAQDTLIMESAQQSTRAATSGQIAGGALGSGATPVRVELPLEGIAMSFEKLLVLDERLWVSFDVLGL